MGPSPILCVLHNITVGPMLKFNGGNNGHSLTSWHSSRIHNDCCGAAIRCHYRESVWGRPPSRQTPPPGQNGRRFWKHYLPSRSVKIMITKHLLSNKVVSLDCGRLGVLVCCTETTRRELGGTRNIKCTEWPLECRRVTSMRSVQGSQGEVIAVPSSPGIQSDITAVPSTPGIQVLSL